MRQGIKKNRVAKTFNFLYAQHQMVSMMNTYHIRINLLKFANNLKLAVAVFSLLILSGYTIYKLNFYHGELDVYIPHFLSGQSLLYKIFNPVAELDFTGSSFRGRELGSFLNFLDIYIAALLVRGWSFGMISIVHYVSVLVIVMLVHFVQKYALRESYSSSLNKIYIILILSCTPIFFGGVLYRTNKIVASVFVAACFTAFIYSRRTSLSLFKSRLTALLILLATIGAGLSDEQGFALVGLLTVYALLESMSKEKKMTFRASALLGGFIFLIIYRVFLGPIIFEQITGFQVSTEIKNETDYGNLRNILASVYLLIRYVGYFFGNPFEGSAATLAVIMLTAIISIRWTNPLALLKKYTFTICLALGGFIAILHVMTLKHPAIYWKDIVSYYSIPIIVAFYFLMIVMIHELNLEGRLNEKIIKNVLMIFVVLNLLSISKNYMLVTTGHMMVFRHASEITSAVNGSPLEVAKTVRSIEISGSAHGKKESMAYGQAGISAIRNFATNE